MSDSNLSPFKYIDSIDTRQHILLLFEDQEYARMIEFRFIKNGLGRGEQCVYATEEDSGSIVLKMLTYGIPLQYFQNGMLQVFQLHNNGESPKEIMEKSKVEITRIMANITLPFRIVSRIIPNVSTINGMSAEMEIEHDTHNKFENFGGSLICPYEVSKIEHTKHKEWIEGLLENHHAIIYATRFDEGSVLLQK